MPTHTCHPQDAHTFSDILIPTHSPTHSGACSHSPRPKKVLPCPLHKLSLPHGPTHEHVPRRMHTHVHATVSHAVFEGKEETTGTNMHACHRYRQQAPPTPVCTSITLTHTLTSAHILVFTLKSSPGSKTQTLKRCLSLDALPALSLHMPTGLHTYAALPTETGFYPPSPPTYRLLLQSHTFPHRNPPSTCTPTHMTSDMSTPEIYCFALSPPTCTHKLLR